MGVEERRKLQAETTTEGERLELYAEIHCKKKKEFLSAVDKILIYDCNMLLSGCSYEEEEINWLVDHVLLTDVATKIAYGYEIDELKYSVRYAFHVYQNGMFCPKAWSSWEPLDKYKQFLNKWIAVGLIKFALFAYKKAREECKEKCNDITPELISEIEQWFDLPGLTMYVLQDKIEDLLNRLTQLTKNA